MDDAHEAGADGLEDGFNLMGFFVVVVEGFCCGGGGGRTHVTTAPMLRDGD